MIVQNLPKTPLSFDHKSVICRKDSRRKHGCQFLVTGELVGKMGEP